MPRLWDKKPIAALQAEAADVSTQELMTHGGVPLKRTLSAMSLMALGIGNIIGAGIFVLTGQAAAPSAASVTATTMLSPKRSTASTRQRSFTAADRGGASRPSSSRH